MLAGCTTAAGVKTTEEKCSSTLSFSKYELNINRILCNTASRMSPSTRPSQVIKKATGSYFNMMDKRYIFKQGVVVTSIFMSTLPQILHFTALFGFGPHFGTFSTSHHVCLVMSERGKRDQRLSKRDCEWRFWYGIHWQRSLTNLYFTNLESDPTDPLNWLWEPVPTVGTLLSQMKYCRSICLKHSSAWAVVGLFWQILNMNYCFCNNNQFYYNAL